MIDFDGEGGMMNKLFVMEAKMTTSFVQFRMEDSTKAQAVIVCEQLGIDLPTYLRMCVSRLVRENGIPFSMKLDENKGECRGLAAMKAASAIAEQNGISEMTLDEINEEIAKARK